MPHVATSMCSHACTTSMQLLPKPLKPRALLQLRGLMRVIPVASTPMEPSPQEMARAPQETRPTVQKLVEQNTSTNTNATAAAASAVHSTDTLTPSPAAHYNAGGKSTSVNPNGDSSTRPGDGNSTGIHNAKGGDEEDNRRWYQVDWILSLVGICSAIVVVPWVSACAVACLTPGTNEGRGDSGASSRAGANLRSSEYQQAPQCASAEEHTEDARQGSAESLDDPNLRHQPASPHAQRMHGSGKQIGCTLTFFKRVQE